MITVVEAQRVIARTKRLVVPLAWSRKLNHSEPAWYEYRSALEYVDDPTETPEGLRVVCQWKPKAGAMPECWLLGLLYREKRIYAIDVQPLTKHKNNVGKGRPFYGKLISGVHEHTWSDEGHGYAEPFTVSPLEGRVAWSNFLAGAGIASMPFVHPDKAINDGQQELGL